MFSFADLIEQPELTEEEAEQVKAPYSLEDRSWKIIVKGRHLCAMGKFNVKDNNEKLKVAAKSARGKSQTTELKRKERDLTPPPSHPKNQPILNDRRGLREL